MDHPRVREYLVDGDSSYEAIGGVTVVDKRDGPDGTWIWETAQAYGPGRCGYDPDLDRTFASREPPEVRPQ